MLNKTIHQGLLVTAMTGLVTACAVTEDALKSSSETLQNTSEASTDFTSSTSHRDEEHRPGAARRFSEANLVRLREDMAAGSGPHLCGLAELLAVPAAKRPAFYAFTKNSFPQLFGSADTGADEMLGHLTDQLKRHPELQ